MQIIKTKEAFQKEYGVYSQILTAGKELPEQVFTNEYKYFAVFEDVAGLVELFMNYLYTYLRSRSEEYFNIVFLDYQADEHYKKFGSYPIVNIDLKNTLESYYDFMHSPDVEITGFTTYLYYSDSRNWGLYIDRGWEFAIMAFKNKEDAREFVKLTNYDYMYCDRREIIAASQFYLYKPIRFINKFNRIYIKGQHENQKSGSLFICLLHNIWFHIKRSFSFIFSVKRR